MWKKVFEILQNIENRRFLQRETPKIIDHISKQSINKLDTDSKHRKRGALPDDEKDIADVQGWAFMMFKQIYVIILGSDQNYDDRHYLIIKLLCDNTITLF